MQTIRVRASSLKNDIDLTLTLVCNLDLINDMYDM